MNPYVAEIEEVLCAFPARTSSQHPESYIGGGQSKLRYIGLRVPQLQQAMKTGFSFSRENTTDVALIWDQIWQTSDCFEVMALAIAWFYEPRQRSLLRGHWPRLKKWAERIDNWAHADTLSGIYARILEDDPKLVYPTLLKWNSSSNPWFRRLSIVSLLYYSSQRSKVLPFKKIISLVKPQLDFDHYYVQKGVGWTLRECGNVYPDETFAFIERHVGKISATAFSAAVEKLTMKQRDQLKRLRKNQRRRPGA